ncbi:MAG: serine/threonine-protein phosphatase [Acidimicrobiaceae bacterium]|nr:serine/threonine-protein phosphatase [Acidimicrobiaceae bacterium]
MQGDPDRLFRTRRPPLPRTELAGFDLAAAWSPWDEASGDLCDWYPSQAGGLTLTVGDVMGMGAPAATLAARLRRALQAASRQAGLAEAVSSTAQHLELHSTTTLVTLLHATLRSDGRLSYIDAGHGLDVLVRDGRLHRLDVRGVPLGVADDSIWQVGQDRLAPGDTLVAFTDGLMISTEVSKRPSARSSTSSPRRRMCRPPRMRWPGRLGLASRPTTSPSS